MRGDEHVVTVVFRRRDGSLSAEWDPAAVALVARCRCTPAVAPPRTWTGHDHEVTETGANAAFAEWDREHAARLLAGGPDTTAPQARTSEVALSRRT